MAKIKRKQFFDTPAHKNKMDLWMEEQSEKIKIIGMTTAPYKTKTRNKKTKPTDIKVITIFYEENKK